MVDIENSNRVKYKFGISGKQNKKRWEETSRNGKPAWMIKKGTHQAVPKMKHKTLDPVAYIESFSKLRGSLENSAKTNGNAMEQTQKLLPESCSVKNLEQLRPVTAPNTLNSTFLLLSPVIRAGTPDSRITRSPSLPGVAMMSSHRASEKVRNKAFVEQRETQCAECGAFIRTRFHEEHLMQECPQRMVLCPLLGCDMEYVYHERASHLKSYCRGLQRREEMLLSKEQVSR
jgi:hypothetical protein